MRHALRSGAKGARMNSSESGIAAQQKLGGAAALYLAIAYLVAMPYFAPDAAMLTAEGERASTRAQRSGNQAP